MAYNFKDGRREKTDMLTLDLSHAFLKEDFHDYREDVAKLDEA